MRVILKNSLACPPYFGLAGDVIDLPETLAQLFIEKDAVEELSAYQKRKAEEKRAQEKPQVEADILISGDKEEAERVEKHLAGIDELFEKQHGESADIEPVETEKKSKKK